MLLGACSSNHFTVRPAPLWPFKQYAVRAGDGPEITAFYSRPDAEPRRLVVVVQSPPCEVHGQPLATQTISTAGVLWKQLSPDSAYIQFDRVGATHGEAGNDCEPGTLTEESWRYQAASAIDAIRKAEGMRSYPTLYLGLGEGAYVASLLATKDRYAQGLVLINGSGMDGFGKLAPRLPVLVVHGSNDARTPLDAAVLLFSQWAPTQHGVSLVMLDAYSHDLNLGSDRPECFEAAMQLIVSRARAMTDAGAAKRRRVEWSNCVEVMREFPEGQ